MRRYALLGAVLLGLAAAGAARADRAVSVTVMLDMDSKQMGRLDRLYEVYARTRLDQETRIAGWQDELKRAQEQMPPDDRKAEGRIRDITGAEQKIAIAFLKARSEAIRQLTPEQRAKLLNAQADRRPAIDDKYRLLLLLKVEDIWQVPVDTTTARELMKERRYEARPRYVYPYYEPRSYWSFGFGWGFRPYPRYGYWGGHPGRPWR